MLVQNCVLYQIIRKRSRSRSGLDQIFTNTDWQTMVFIYEMADAHLQFCSMSLEIINEVKSYVETHGSSSVLHNLPYYGLEQMPLVSMTTNLITCGHYNDYSHMT